jgi:hypothetical protein
VAYQWVKCLGDMLMLDAILFDAKILKRVLKEADIKDKAITLGH